MADEKPKLPPEVAATPIRHDMDDGLRFLHVMGMQTKHDLFESQTKLVALLEELVAAGLVDPKKLEEKRLEASKAEAQRVKKNEQAVVQVSDVLDKYQLKSPDVDCEARFPLCKARCCTFYFPLSFQDLDERVMQWDYALPYLSKKREDDHRCVHQKPDHFCGIYEKRPAACRQYSCKDDKRIWIDFEKRIPAPEDETLYGIRPHMRPRAP